MLRFDAQRSGKHVQLRDKRFDNLESSIVKTMKCYSEGLFRNDLKRLSAIAKLYVESTRMLKS